MDEAYDGAQANLPEVLRIIHDAIAEVPQTCDELEVSLGRTHQSVSPALFRLREMGRIEPSGIKRLTRSRKPAIVWRIKSSEPPKPEPAPAAEPAPDSLFPMPPLRWRIG
jgi:hypothetical protein